MPPLSWLSKTKKCERLDRPESDGMVPVNWLLPVKFDYLTREQRRVLLGRVVDENSTESGGC